MIRVVRWPGHRSHREGDEVIIMRYCFKAASGGHKGDTRRVAQPAHPHSYFAMSHFLFWYQEILPALAGVLCAPAAPPRTVKYTSATTLLLLPPPLMRLPPLPLCKASNAYNMRPHVIPTCVGNCVASSHI